MINNRWFFIQSNGEILEVKHKNNQELTFNPYYKLTIPDKLKSNKNVQLKVFQNSPSDQVYILLGTRLYSLDFFNESFSLKLIMNQIPIHEFIRYLQIDKFTQTFYFGTDNKGVLVGRPQYFKRVLPKNFIEGKSTSAYAQLQLNNGNIQINSGQIFGDNLNKTSLVFNKPSSAATYTSSDSILYYTNSDGIIEYDLKRNKKIVQD